MFSKPYLEPETVAAQKAKGYGLGQAKKTIQLSKSAKKFNHFLFGNKSIIYYYCFQNNRLVRIDIDSYSVIDKSL